MPYTDVTGIELKPGNPQQCPGNSTTPNSQGGMFECCCDECDYLLICMEADAPEAKQCE